MPNCNFNGVKTGPYYPCQVCTCRCGSSCSGGGNGVINPSLEPNFAYLGKEEVVEVSASGKLPLDNIVSKGSAILLNDSVDISLTAGVYLINYSVNFITNTASEVIEVALFENEEKVANSQVQSVSGSAGDSVSLSKQLIFQTAKNTSVSLRNLSANTISFENTAITIFKIPEN